MRRLNKTSARLGRLITPMCKPIVLGLLMLVLPALALAQNDPLSPSYLPAIDTNPADYPSNIWITDSMQKVRQDSGSPGTQHWGTFYGTQNEFVDFQVHFHDTGSGTSNLSVTVSNFVQSSPSSSTINCSTLGQCVVYREAYVNVQKYPTNNSSSRAWNTFYGTTGYYPDILIPAVDPYWGQTTNAWPFTVAAGKNQSAWIDVLIPQKAPSGYYSGTVTVKSGSTTLATMPVTIAVWQWPNSGYMPSTPTLTMIGAATNWSYEALCTQMYSPAATSDVSCNSYPGESAAGFSNDDRYVWMDAALVMKDHRWSAGAVVPGSGITTGSFSAYNALGGPNLNGTCNLHYGAGTTCPILPGSKDNAQAMCFPYSNCPSPSAATWTNWLSNFSTQGWSSDLFIYFCDETYCTSSALASADTAHTYTTPGIPLLATMHLTDLQASSHPTAIDWLVDGLNVGENTSGYPTWLQGSTDGITRKWLSYMGCGQTGTCSDGSPGPGPAGWTYATFPNYVVDGLPVANRAMEWLTYISGQTGELYYGEDICEVPSYYSSGQCTPSGVSYDPWSGIYYAGGWGDGTRLYAGSIVSGSVNYMGSGVTIPIILPSIRLTLARDGVQDYEYLNVLTQKGQGTLAMNAAKSWITDNKTFNVNPSVAAYGFTSDLTDARTNLGNALNKLTYGAVVLPPTSLTATLQ